MKCRFDQRELTNVFLDLGHCPPSNSYVTREGLDQPEVTYPLKVYVNESNFYVQVPEFKKATEIFNSNYAYFSSFSTSWLKHCENYVTMMKNRFELSPKSFVVEVASNDGYLLQYFKGAQIPCIGIEPSSSVAEAARKKGIETEVEFFGKQTAEKMRTKYQAADVILGNNVFAHVPDVNDFIQGLKSLLAPTGVVTLEFPHLLNLIEENQFDTIYHEHYSYFSLYTVSTLVKPQGLEIFDVEEIPTHGGSLRVYLKHKEDASKSISLRVKDLMSKEERAGLLRLDTYLNFHQRAEKIKLQFLSFLIDQKKANKKVVAYGAAAKGNTMLNYCGVKSDMIDFVVDKSQYKQNLFMPGSHIPIVHEEKIRQAKPDYVIILPWNLKDEVSEQLSYIREWGGKFVTAVPELRTF